LATDGGGRTGEALVTVTVNRNLASPVFAQEAYTVSIQDNEPLASSFLQVQAQDDDVQVYMAYSIVQFSQSILEHS
jgi:hypothetical protein